MNERTRKLGRLVKSAGRPLALATLALAAFALAQTVAPASALMVTTAQGLGDHVTDAAGMSLYLFLNDTTGVSNCTDQCAVNWPPLLVAGEDSLPTVPASIDAGLLGVAERADGTYQLTLNGWPLYHYSGDAKAGDTNGQGVGDNWYLVTPQGTGVGLDATQPGGGAPDSAM